MKFTRNIETDLSNEEIELLKKIGKHGYIFNFDAKDREKQLDLCDGLRNKGVLNEDGDGRVRPTNWGWEILEQLNF